MARRHIRPWFLFLPAIVAFASVPVAGGFAAGNADELEIALDLATMLQSARSIIAAKQDLINDPKVGDKGLGAGIVQAMALEKFRKAKSIKGHAEDIDPKTLRGRLLKAQIAAIGSVMEENQPTINQSGVGFKGFVPAVFARLVNEEFKRKMGQEAEIKVTAPRKLVRNRKALPDSWETEAIRSRLSSPQWPKGKVYFGSAENQGRPAFRILVPEYYSAGCLACHGEPKGALDITGYPKEGGKLGDLGGVISVTLYRHQK